jgi:hypothetical protein
MFSRQLPVMLTNFTTSIPTSFHVLDSLCSQICGFLGRLSKTNLFDIQYLRLRASKGKTRVLFFLGPEDSSDALRATGVIVCLAAVRGRRYLRLQLDSVIQIQHFTHVPGNK